MIKEKLFSFFPYCKKETSLMFRYHTELLHKINVIQMSIDHNHQWQLPDPGIDSVPGLYDKIKEVG